VTVLSFAMTAGSTAGQAAQLARRCELTILRPARWPWYANEPRLAVEGAQVIDLPVSFPGHHHFHLYRGLSSALRRTAPDLLYIDQEPWTVSSAHAAYLAARIPCPVVGFTWQNIMKRYPPPFPALERSVHRRATMIIAGNEDAAEVLRRRGYRGLVRVIPQFGVDLDLFRPGSPTRAELGLPPDGVAIGFIGRLVAEKGIDTAIRAIAGVPEARLVLVGVGPLENALRALADELAVADRIHFLGGYPSDKVSTVLRGLDGLILPSRTTRRWKEQFGRVLIEAMAAEVPVIGSNSAEIPNVIGAAGLVFEEGSVEDCARAIRGLLNPDARRGLAVRGADRVRACYDQAIIAQRFWEAWRQAFEAWHSSRS
jgi:glycosyltransferase involved in cell wall biosynthesis